VPRVNLPPALPLEQVASGYPEVQRDEAPTWIASADLRAEMLGEWPVAAPVAAEPELEPVLAELDPWSVAELPAAPLDEGEDEPDPERREGGHEAANGRRRAARRVPLWRNRLVDGGRGDGGGVLFAREDLLDRLRPPAV